MFSYGIHGTHRTFLLYILPRNSQNTQNFLAVKCLPQIARIFTDAAFKWVHLRICVEWDPWENSFSSLFREFREFCGRKS